MSFEDILGSETEVLDPAPVGPQFRSLGNKFVHDLERGVTETWLAQAFQLRRARVKQLMVGCPVIGTAHGGMKVYSFAEAMKYMVKPRVNLKRYLEGLDPKDLPEQLRSEFWGARLKEQKARLNAKDLWRSEDVVAAFGELFKMIKDTAILWPDALDESTDLSHEQRDLLDNMVRDLLSQIGDTVMNYTTERKTQSQEFEFDIADEDEL